jgi:hypothetical protein
MRVLLPILLAAATVAAKPPKAPEFKRHDTLHFDLAKAYQVLEAKEQFEAKPRIEKIILLFQDAKGNETKYFGEGKEKVKLVGDDVAKEILENWKEIQTPRVNVSEENIRILWLLIPAMQAHYAAGREFDKKERYDASRVLVDALMSDYIHIRSVAIECLKKIYRNEGRFYRPEQSKKDRLDKQKGWKKFIRKEYTGR